MKVTAEKITPTPKFWPIEVKIVLETAEEFKALYEVGNHCTVVQEFINERTEKYRNENAKGLPIHEVLKSIYEALKEHKLAIYKGN